MGLTRDEAVLAVRQTTQDTERGSLLSSISRLTDEELQDMCVDMNKDGPKAVVQFIRDRKHGSESTRGSIQGLEGVKGKGGSKSGSPGTSHEAPARSVAFSDPSRTLFNYIPGIKEVKVNCGLPQLRTIRHKEIPLESELCDDVCEALVGTLLKPLLRGTVCSSNEASKGLPVFQAFEKLLRRNPFMQPAFQAVVDAHVSDSLTAVEGRGGSMSLESVEEMEGMSRSILQQNICHEEWLHVPSVVKGRIELQIQCTQHDDDFIMGACELAYNLDTADAVRSKLHQVYKEAFAIWYKNAANGVMRPVKMLLSDGKWFMRVNLNIDTPFTPKMDIKKITGSFTASSSFSLTAGNELGTSHVLNAVRLLASWLWEGSFKDVTVERITAALASAREKGAERLHVAISAGNAVDRAILDHNAKRQKQTA